MMKEFKHFIYLFLKNKPNPPLQVMDSKNSIIHSIFPYSITERNKCYKALSSNSENIMA